MECWNDGIREKSLILGFGIVGICAFCVYLPIRVIPGQNLLLN